eukprot:g2779.t1
MAGIPWGVRKRDGGDFTETQLKSRWEVLKQTSNSTARAWQCNASLHGQLSMFSSCKVLDGLSLALQSGPIRGFFDDCIVDRQASAVEGQETRPAAEAAGSEKRGLVIEAEGLGIEGLRKVRIKAEDMKTTAQLHQFLCVYLGIDAPSDVDMMVPNAFNSRYIHLQRIDQIKADGRIQLVRSSGIGVVSLKPPVEPATVSP